MYMTKKELKKKIKSVNKFSDLLYKNSKEIEFILSSELFLQQLVDVGDYIEVDLKEEELYICQIPVQMSNFVNEGCILVLKNEEYVILKGI